MSNSQVMSSVLIGAAAAVPEFLIPVALPVALVVGGIAVYENRTAVLNFTSSLALSALTLPTVFFSSDKTEEGSNKPISPVGDSATPAAKPTPEIKICPPGTAKGATGVWRWPSKGPITWEAAKRRLPPDKNPPLRESPLARPFKPKIK